MVFTNKDKIKQTEKYSTEHVQKLSCSVEGNLVLRAYISLTTPAPELKKLLALAEKCLRATTVLVVDFNTRHRTWDERLNYNGTILYNRAQCNKLLNASPSAPTFETTHGKSRVDLVFHCGTTAPSICTLHYRPSDHRSTVAKLVL